MAMYHTYQVIELVGSSPDGVQQAIENAVNRASQTLSGLDWFEVKEIRGAMKDGKIGWYQVKLGIGFRIIEPEDINRE